jgi:hypothetical protein
MPVVIPLPYLSACVRTPCAKRAFGLDHAKDNAICTEGIVGRTVRRFELGDRIVLVGVE